MFKLTSTNSTQHCPCSIDYINQWNLFIIGTYELDDQADQSINQRFGSFVLIHNERFVLEQICAQGGVFDFRTITRNTIDTKSCTTVACEESSIEDCHQICSNCSRSSTETHPKNDSIIVHLYAAHSNGNLSLFEIRKLDDDHFGIDEIHSLNTGSSMLTCLDFVELENRKSINEKNNINSKHKEVLVIVGDSCSMITIVRNQQILNKFRVDKFDYPIWSIKILNQSNEDHLTVFTGSDDCVLRCFDLRGNDFQDHSLLLKIGDEVFAGGVTSIEIVNEPVGQSRIDEIESHVTRDRTDEMKLKNDLALKILVGSYDEKLRTFSLKLNSESVESNRRFTLELMKTIGIEKAGVWKIKHHKLKQLDQKKCNYEFELITGMYSGIHLIKDDQLISTFNQLPVDESKRNDEHEDEHLIYGCCFNENLSRLLITSFYKKTVFCFSTNTEQLYRLLAD